MELVPTIKKSMFIFMYFYSSFLFVFVIKNCSGKSLLLCTTKPQCQNSIKYSQKRTCADTVPISTFMCLRAIYIFLRSICLFLLHPVAFMCPHRHMNVEIGTEWDFPCSVYRLSFWFNCSGFPFEQKTKKVKKTILFFYGICTPSPLF